MSGYNTVELFGGAIVASLPATFADVSDIRQIPDNQEVYLDKDGFSSIVIEILERVEKPDIEALKYHLHDLVEEDEGETRIFTTGDAHFAKLSQSTPAYTLLATAPPGAQQRGRSNEPQFLGILLTVIRLVEKKTDLLVVVNVPHVPGSFDAGEVDPESGKYGKLLEAAMEHRTKILETLEIRDWNLFVQE